MVIQRFAKPKSVVRFHPLTKQPTKGMRSFRSIPFVGSLYLMLVMYPAPINLSYMWNFGIYSLFRLGIQILTGIFLAMHYVSDIMIAFTSIEHIMRDVLNGWLFRYIHANGASMFFIVVYAHTFRGLYYSSYVRPREALWGVGVIILLLMILTAFLGYVLPWGQMSFRGATVITNLAPAIPYVGNNIVVWLWGGYSVDNATLMRFFSFHYLFPFILVFLVGLHLILLHETLSTNPLGVKFKLDKTYLFPHYFLKDLFGVLGFLFFASFFFFFMPNILGHSDNYIGANSLVTPAHIVPEWYFLPFYAILRSIPDKLGGVCALLFSIFVLYLMPFSTFPEIKSSHFRPMFKYCFWVLFLDSIVLDWLGSQTVKYPFIEAGQISTILYFCYFLMMLPIIARLEIFFWSGHSDKKSELECK